MLGIFFFLTELLFFFFHQASGLQWLSEEFSLCTPLKNKNDAVSFKSWLQETWVNLAMVDYPYEANFLQPLPRWPIQVQTGFLLI